MRDHPESSRSAVGRPASLVLGLLGLLWFALAANWFFAIGRFQANVLVLDQWDFFSPVFDDGGLWQTFNYQHGPHRQGLSFVITSWIYRATAWDARFDSVWVAGLIAGSALLALRLKWRLTGSLRVADAWILLLLMSLRQFEPVLITPNASHGVFPLFLILVIGNAWLSPHHALRYVTAGIGGWLLTFSGFGMFGAIALMLVLIVDAIRLTVLRERKQAALAIAALVVVASSWPVFLSNYSFGGALDGASANDVGVRDYFRFVVLMLGHLCGLTSGSWIHHVLGSIVAVATLTALWSVLRGWFQPRAEPARKDVLLFLFGSGVLFVGVTTAGRIGYGVDAGLASRYLPLLFPIPLAIVFAAGLHHNPWVQRCAVAAVSLATLVPYAYSLARPPDQWPGTLGLRSGRFRQLESASNSELIWVDAYLRTGDLQAAQQAAGWRVYPSETAERLLPRLAFLQERRLSFFASPPEQADHLPWLLRERVLWDQALHSVAQPTVLGDRAALTFITRRPGFAEMLIATDPHTQTDNAWPQIHVAGELSDATIVLSSRAQVVSVPVRAGVNRIVLARAPAPAAGDARIRIDSVRWAAAPAPEPLAEPSAASSASGRSR